MQLSRWKLVIGSAVVLASVSYLAIAGLKEGWVYHMQVSEFVQKTDLAGQRLRICGRVSPIDFNSAPAKMLASFRMGDNEGKTDRTIPVVYRGTVPDLFKIDADVIVEGKVDSTGSFQADVLMTKCASKYQAQTTPRKEAQ